jgi:hypothetical protein
MWALGQHDLTSERHEVSSCEFVPLHVWPARMIHMGSSPEQARTNE